MTILLSVLAGLLIWILLLYLVNQAVFGRILTPFYDTVETLEEISSPSDLEESFPHSNTYELDVLNNALNSMMKEIRSSFEDQKKFIQNVSHELLTPLSIVRQKAEKILSHPEKLDRSTIESVNDIQQTVVRLSRLSNALLLISRVENKQYKLDEQVNIQAICEAVITELSDFVRMKDISLTKEYDSHILVEGNQELMHSAIYNILQNAIKYSPAGTTITISIENETGSPQLLVCDQGPGIPEELIDSAFDRFKKGSNSWHGQDNSPGLGLSIVQSICQLHKFEAFAANRPSVGAEVGIRFGYNPSWHQNS